MASAMKAEFFRRALLIGLMSVVALAFILFAMRESLLEFAGKEGLSLAGFTDVTLTVDEVASDQLRIAELSLGDQISLQNITVHFRPFALLQGRVAAIDIGNLFVDLSEPESRAIAKLREFAGEGSGESEAAADRNYPAVYLKQGKFIANTKGRTFEAVVAGALTGDMLLKGEGVLNGRVETAGGPVLFENIQVSVDSDIPARSAKFLLGGGLISHDVANPDWAPFLLSGDGTLEKEHLTGRMTIKTAAGQSLMQFAGGYDMASGTGSAQFALTNLVFRRNGLQPVDLSRYAESLPPFDGRFNLSADADFEGTSVSYKAEVSVDELTVDMPDGRAASDHLLLNLSGRYSLADKKLSAEARLPDTDVHLDFQGRRYHLKNLRSAAKVDGFAETIELVSLDGAIEDMADTPDFAPLFFSATGKMDAARALNLKGIIRDATSNFKIDLSGSYEADKGTGALSVHLPETKIGKGGISLAALSRHLDTAGEAFSGTVAAEAVINRLADGALVASTLKAAVKDGRWRQGDTVASGFRIDLTGTQAGARTPISGRVNGRINNLIVDGQDMSIPDFDAAFSGGLDNLSPGDEGRLEIARITVKPLKDALFRETQTATGVVALKKDEVRFSIDLASDYLGSFAHMTGRHSIAQGSGAANIEINPLTFAKGGLQPQDILAIDGEITVDGQITPAAILTWRRGGLNGSVDIGIRDIAVKTSGGEINGLDGNVHVDELFPLTIATAQEITARTAVAGIPLEEPFLRFRVVTKNGAPVLYIDRLTVGLVGGTAFIDRAAIDTGAKINRMEVQLTNLDLEEVMALSNVEELVATGKVSGRVPLIFGGERLVVDGGLLAADGPGLLKMTSEAARRALGGGGEQAKLLLDILENFHYSELSIQVMKTESGDDMVKLHAAGSNPDVENNRPVVLNINLSTSLDKIFNAILDGYLLSEKALRATVGNR